MSSQTQTADVAMVDTSHDLHLFDQATSDIQNTISENHRQDFLCNASASLLLDELQASFTSTSICDQRLVACSQKFALLVQNFAPYFEILALCVQLRSEWASWLWGTIRLVFRISSNHPVFLEKAADMLETIAHIVSPYRQMYEGCNRNGPVSHLAVQDLHLAALMSNVYADIVCLCLDLYKIFCRSARAHTLNDSRHESNRSVLWRPLDYRFARLEVRLVRHRKWLERETEGQAQNYSEIAMHRREYATFLSRQSGFTGNNGEDSNEQMLARRIRRIDKAREWLSNGSLISCPETHRSHQSPMCSCDWFFKSPTYRRWKDIPFERRRADDLHALAGDWQHRILFVQAREGFGKTTIAQEVAAILEVNGDGPDPSTEASATASFYFDLKRPQMCYADQAMRSLASQLLYTHRREPLTLDAVCLMLRRTSFRETATTEEVMAVLSLLLHQHPTYLVIDGVDECNDIEVLLTSLAQLSRKSDTRAILFSRPNIKIPLEYQKWASDAPHIFTLTNQHNAVAIEHFLSQLLNQMADQGFFGIAIDRTIIPRVAQVSNGELLWVRILLNLLQSPVLSARERYATLQNVQFLRGLETLYHSVLVALQRRSARERRMIADAFRWLSFSIHSLSPSAMGTALSAVEDHSSDMVDGYDLLHSLPELTCGLLHLENGTITFTHRSIPDFLQAHATQLSEFSLCSENEAHAQLAARCLLQLACNMPQQPLGALRPPSPPRPPIIASSSSASQRTNRSEDSGYKSLSSSDGDSAIMQPAQGTNEHDPRNHNLRTLAFDSHLPFLRYTALCWPIHLSRALSPSLHNIDLSSPESYPYLPALYAFLSSRLAITVWVEASYRYNLPPTLSRLVGPLSDLKSEISPATVKGRELRFVVTALRELSERLVELKRGFEGALRQNPSLIWQMTGLGVGAYWPVWEEILGVD